MATNKKSSNTNKKTNASVSKVVKKTAKKTIKSAKKGNKGAIAIIAVVLVLLLVASGVFAGLYFTGKLDSVLKRDTTNPTTQGTVNTLAPNTTNVVNGEDGITENIIYDNFQIHFLELGNEYAGDSTYIKAGDVDILIDAGSRGNSAKAITDYVDKYCTDGKLEYVISTHNHQDHIAGFAGAVDNKATNFKGEKVGRTGVLYHYEVETLIDFTYATVSVTVDGKKKDVTYNNKVQKSSDFGSGTEYGKYLAAREYAISKGTTYYTAKELWDSNNTKFTVAPNITMDILYNYYYFNESNDINNFSVCSLFSYNNHHYLLTGDLEKEGEEKLAEYYDGSTEAKTLPHCDLFKAGHHGSRTSSNDCLLDKITPSICVACCCAGSTEYTIANDTIFPTQEFINRIAKHTSRVYVTSIYLREPVDGNKFTSMNGDVVVSSNGIDVGLKASNNLIRLKDTTWFNQTIYVVDGKVASGTKGSTDFYTESSPGATAIPQRIWPSYGVQ